MKENSLEMVDVRTADKVHKHIVDQIKKYKETKNEEYLRIVVCGAGFTGIELVGEGPWWKSARLLLILLE